MIEGARKAVLNLTEKKSIEKTLIKKVIKLLNA